MSVQILPSARTPWDLIGEQAGQVSSNIISNVLPQQMQQQYTQKMLQDALTKTQQEVKAPEFNAMNPAEKFITLAKHGAGIPGYMQALSQVYPHLMTQAAAGQQPESLTTAMDLLTKMKGGGPTPQGPKATIPYAPGKEPMAQTVTEKAKPLTTKQNNVVSQYANDYLKEVRPDLFENTFNFSKIATFNPDQPSALRPEEEASIRKQLNARGVIPAMQDRVVEQINNDIATRHKEMVTNFGLSRQRMQDLGQKWKDFKNYAYGTEGGPGPLRTALAPFQEKSPKLTNDLANKYFDYAEQQDVNLTPEKIHANAFAALQRDINAFQALKEVPALPPIRSFSDYKKNMETNQKAYAPLLKLGYGQSLLEDAIKNKDMGPEEAHYAVYGPQTSKESIKAIEGVRSPYSQAMTAGGGRLSVDAKEKSTYLDKLSGALSKIKDKDDLMILRSIVLNNGGSEQDFMDALEMAVGKGLQLSQFQASQLQDIAVPRERPIWEFFIPSRWGDFFQLMRGKK